MSDENCCKQTQLKVNNLFIATVYRQRKYANNISKLDFDARLSYSFKNEKQYSIDV